VVDDERHTVFLLEFDLSCETAFKASLPFLGLTVGSLLAHHLPFSRIGQSPSLTFLESEHLIGLPAAKLNWEGRSALEKFYFMREAFFN
jgi:hypothetical protein